MTLLNSCMVIYGPHVSRLYLTFPDLWARRIYLYISWESIIFSCYNDRNDW